MRLLMIVGVALSIVSCHRSEEPSTVRGKLFMLVSESHLPLIKEEAAQFMTIYDKTKITAVGTTTREAIVALLNDSVRCICVDRKLNEEELNVVQRSGIKLATVRIGRDALVVIVNDENPLRTISLGTVKAILEKSVTTWGKVPGSRMTGRLELVLAGKNSGSYELLQRGFFSLAKEIVPDKIGDTEKQIVGYVAATPGALGIVSLAAVVGHPKGIHTLAVETPDSTLKNEAVIPSQSNVYEELYPLNYSLYLYISEPTLGVGSGFSTFVMTLHGQQ
ncbi:MAG TPA: substrate-binding domain-containing protein, partial [Bacteroidota bacterium]